jgi:hypothetical protein
MMRRRAQVRQFELFCERMVTIEDCPASAWQGLPEATRRALTGLMSRLLLDHCCLNRRPSWTEAADDV